MDIMNFDKAPAVMEKNGVTARKMFDTAQAAGIQMRLEPGGFVEDHPTDMDVVFYVNTGRVTVSVGAEKIPVQAPAAVLSPKNIPHGLQNQTESVAEVLVLKLKN